jgi:hypothetical protein
MVGNLSVLTKKSARVELADFEKVVAIFKFISFNGKYHSHPS